MDPPSPLRPRSILLHVDDSRHWVPAVHWVGSLARETGASVTVLSTTWSRARREEAVAAARGILALPPGQVQEAARVGLVERVVPDEAVRGGHDLVVVGRLGGLDWLTNHLVAIHVVRRSPVTTLIVRGKLERLERVLVATAGRAGGPPSVDAAVLLARTLGARITVLHVLSHLALTDAAHDELAGQAQAFLASEHPVAGHLRDAQEALQAGGVRGSVKVRMGPVVDEVVHEVTEGQHDLLVLGAHEEGRSDVYQDLAALLLRASPVSCLVVRSPADRRGA